MPTQNGVEEGEENKRPNTSICKCYQNERAMSKIYHAKLLGTARVLEMIITTTYITQEIGTYNAKNHVASIHVQHMARHMPKVSICLTP